MKVGLVLRWGGRGRFIKVGGGRFWFQKGEGKGRGRLTKVGESRVWFHVRVDGVD